MVPLPEFFLPVPRVRAILTDGGSGSCRENEGRKIISSEAEVVDEEAELASTAVGGPSRSGR